MDMDTVSTDPDALYRYSMDMVRHGAFERAAELLRTAIDLAPTATPTATVYHCSLARIACQLDDWQSAARAFDGALTHGAEHMDAHDHYDHGAVLTALSRHADATAAYRRALQLEPEWPLLLDNLAVSLHFSRRFAEAEDAFERALAAHEPASRPFTLRNLASLLVQLDRYPEAIARYREALDYAPDDPYTHRDLAATLHASDQYEAAERHYRRAVALAPSWTDPARHLADLLAAVGRPEQAEPIYRQLLADDPDASDVPDILNGLGTCLNALERLDEAMDTLERLVAMAPDNGLYHYNLAVVLERADRTEAALDVYRTAIAHAPDMLDAHSSLAAALYRLGRLDEARVAYHDVARLDPDDEIAQHLLTALDGRVSASAPPTYVARVFDDYSERYDQHMRTQLGYRAPEFIRMSILAAATPPLADCALLDLGCGTGLMAEALRAVTRVAHGVDLAPKMIQQARARGLYEQLFEGELVAMLADQTRGLPCYDLITAADVLVYIGDLAPLMNAAVERLTPAGMLAFSVEEHDGDSGDGYALATTGRYAHSRDYIARTARACGLSVHTFDRAHVRLERGQPVHGLVCVLKRGDARGDSDRDDSSGDDSAKQ